MANKLEIFNIPFNTEYKFVVAYNTTVDEHFSGAEQRRGLWDHPRRMWTLDFQKDPDAQRAFIEFFERKKGKLLPFYFFWEKSKGGDDNYYEVRFAEDDLNMNYDYKGFASFQATIIQTKPYPIDIT